MLDWLLPLAYKGCIGSGWAANGKTGEMTMTDKTPNFTEANETRIREAVAANGGKMDKALAESLAVELGKPSFRSISAKAVRMGLPYARKAPARKDGTPVENKAKIVEAIAAVVSGNLDGLDKAPREALLAIRRAVNA